MALAIVSNSVSNFAQTGAKILLDLINYDNSTALPASALTFGAPAVVAEDNASGLITTVVATAATFSGYTGTQTFTYNRVDLGFMLVNEVDLLIETEVTSVHALLPALNSTFGINLTADDVVDAVIPATEADVVTPVTITATATSLVWAKSVTINVTKGLIALDSVLTKATLDGLYTPLPQPQLLAPAE